MIISKQKNLLKNIKIILSENIVLEKKLLKICHEIKNNFTKYDWVGFYFSDSINKKLNLVAFSGKKTEHNQIPFGKGVCGQVAISNKTLVIPNIKAEKNYISCNINVKSEIVVPIIINGSNIGQIDVDSNTINAFSNEDKIFLEEVCDLISTKYKLLT
jgi:GAF domain-containing protein